jgi:hypothetical protein
MTMDKIETPHFRKIIAEMCRRVGADPKKVNPKKKDWFMKHSWTEEEQDDFVNWATDYLYKNPEARKEILNHPTRNKKLIKGAMEELVLKWGWKFEKEFNQYLCYCGNCRKFFLATDEHHNMDYCPYCKKTAVDIEEDYKRLLGSVKIVMKLP